MPSEDLLQKAERFIRSARLLVDDGDYDSAASRLYYAMYFVAEALLETKQLSFSSHRAVQAAYGTHFAKTGELEPRFHRALLNAFQQRQLGDYLTGSQVAPEVVKGILTDAMDFLAAARNWLAQQG